MLPILVPHPLFGLQSVVPSKQYTEWRMLNAKDGILFVRPVSPEPIFDEEKIV